MGRHVRKVEGNRARRADAEESPRLERSRTHTLISGLLVVVAVGVAYANSLRCPFFFDDDLTIIQNPTIRALRPLSVVLSPPGEGSPVQGRPLVNLSFAVNYAVGGTAVLGYHLFNLGVHTLAALILMAVVRRTLTGSERCRRLAGAATGISATVALIWAVHPLVTEPVTYLTQRTESMVGLFYLLTLYLVIRGAQSDKPARWFGLATLACALGMASKEVMVTAPVVILAYDAIFLSGSVREAVRRRRGLYLGLAATWSVLGYILITTGFARGSSAGFGGRLTAWQYGRTQCWAILRYLRLALVPHPLVVDYGEWIAGSARDIVPGAAAILILVAATLVALAKAPGFGFLGIWFFVILSPTSSVIPLVGQTVAEKRMYLPLAAVVTAVFIGLHLAWRRVTGAGEEAPGRPRKWRRWAPAVAVAGIACALVAMTRDRNRDYSDALTLWQDTARKVPHNERAQYNLGLALVAAGRTADALEPFRTAAALMPNHLPAQFNAAEALVRLGRPTEALPYLRALQAGVASKPADEEAQQALVRLLFRLGRRDEAVASARSFVDTFPALASSNSLYGSVLSRTGHALEGLQYLERARRLAASDRAGTAGAEPQPVR